MTEASWLVVRVRSGQGARAEQNAQQQGYEWYVPRGLFRSPRTRQLRVEPLFPGYAFARHLEGQWQSLTGTFGVAEVLKVAEDVPARLPHSEIVHWRAREGPDGLVRMTAQEFTRGEHVRVDRGAITLDAVVDGMAGHDRIFVLLGVLGGARAEVPVSDVTHE